VVKPNTTGTPARIPGGYPHGRRGAYAHPCPECGANVGSRCIKFRRDPSGVGYPIGTVNRPHPARRALNNGDTT
jgi:hypothetical protein